MDSEVEDYAADSNFRLEHIIGSENKITDLLSRLRSVRKESTDTTGLKEILTDISKPRKKRLILTTLKIARTTGIYLLTRDKGAIYHK